MKGETTIKYALNKETGEIIDADEVFNNREIGFNYRTEYNREEFVPYCLECDKELTVSSSKYDRVYFKHFPNSEYCFLKDEKLTPKEKIFFLNTLKSKESERHIFLKNRIGKFLSEIADVQEVHIDDKFIFNNKGEKRKPDVYCKYGDKELVFEIQLSDLSQRYLLSRYDFYKSQGIYLIWILDNFDVLGNSQTEKDIKYLSQHQNYFRFNDSIEEFKLNCKFKQTKLSPSTNEFYDEWQEVNITLDKLSFDEEYCEVYFHNFLKEKTEILALQKKYEPIIEKKRQEREAKKEQERIAYKIHHFLEKIAEEKESIISNFTGLQLDLRYFEENEIIALNNRLDLNNNQRVFRWFQEAKNYDYDFLVFILTSHQIEVDINQKDKEGNNLLYYIFKNEDIYEKYEFLRLLFECGFEFSKNDEAIIEQHYGSNEYLTTQRVVSICYLANRIRQKRLYYPLFEYRNQMALCIIESCIQNKIIGYKYQHGSWIMFANNAIQHYSDYWEYLESVFKEYGLFDRLIQLDKKGTFQKKLQQHYLKEIETNYLFEELFKELYPELCQ